MSVKYDEIVSIIYDFAVKNNGIAVQKEMVVPGSNIEDLALAIIDYLEVHRAKFRSGDTVRRAKDYRNAKRRTMYGEIIDVIYKDDIIKYKVKWDEPSGIWNHKKDIFNPNGGRLFSTIQEKGLMI